MRLILLLASLLASLLAAAAPAAGQVLDAGTFAADLTAEGWSLNGGSGRRTHILFIRFARPFPARPAVLLSLSGLDGGAGSDGNVRVTVDAENVTREGFVLTITTWADSRITGVSGQWLAATEGSP